MNITLQNFIECERRLCQAALIFLHMVDKDRGRMPNLASTAPQ